MKMKPYRTAAWRIVRRTGIPKISPLRAYIGHPFFPLTFWLESIAYFWSYYVHQKRGLNAAKKVMRSLAERANFFSEISTYQNTVYQSFESKNKEDNSNYCHQCGQCCQFASGYPSFPENWPFPKRWKRWFADGCGQEQLFCAFLFEDAQKGKGYCSIYPFRPLVCRLFGKEECLYLIENLEKDTFTRKAYIKRRISILLRNHASYCRYQNKNRSIPSSIETTGR